MRYDEKAAHYSKYRSDGSATSGDEYEVDRLIRNRTYHDSWPAAAGGLGYMLLALGVISLTADGRYVSTIWPADALLLAIILPLAPRRWPLYCAGGLLGNLVANAICFGWGIAPLFYGLSNIAGIWIAALLLRRANAHINPLDNVRSMFRFVLAAGIVAPAASGAGGALTAHLLFGQPLWTSYATWYSAAALGLLIFTPLFAGILSGTFARWIKEMSHAARIETAAIIAFVILCGLFTFMVVGYPMLFLMTAPIMLATFRLGQFGTKLSLIICAVIGVVCTMEGRGPIAAMIADRGEQALFLQFYLAVLLLSTLPVSAELTARRALARRLAESEASLRLLASESADALVRLDENGICVQTSGATTMLMGVETEELIGCPLAALVAESDSDALSEALFQALRNPGTVAYCEFHPRDRADEWLECTLRALVDRDGCTYGAIGAIRDITIRKERELDLSLAASTDSLTGMLNHAAFMAHLDHALAHLTSSHLALIMIDIDHFKQVNDQHGHPAGDAVLKELASRFRALVRDHDAIGRLGGDEIAILLDGTSEELGLSIAEAIRVAISARPIALSDDIRDVVTISCGVAQAYPGISRAQLLRNADDALYQAKDDGRNRVVSSAI